MQHHEAIRISNKRYKRKCLLETKKTKPWINIYGCLYRHKKMLCSNMEKRMHGAQDVKHHGFPTSPKHILYKYRLNSWQPEIITKQPARWSLLKLLWCREQYFHTVYRTLVFFWSCVEIGRDPKKILTIHYNFSRFFAI